MRNNAKVFPIRWWLFLIQNMFLGRQSRRWTGKRLLMWVNLASIAGYTCTYSFISDLQGNKLFFPQHSSVTHETAELLYVKLMSKNNLPLNILCRRDSYSEKIKNALVWLIWYRSEGLDLKVSLTLWSVWREWFFAWRLNFDV